jgi:hypothetical protein
MFRNICLTLTAFFIGFVCFSQVRKDDPVKKVADSLIVADTLVIQDSINTISMAEFIWGKQMIGKNDTLNPSIPDFESKKIVWVETRTSGYTTLNGGGVRGSTSHSGHVWYEWRYQNSSELMSLGELKSPMSEYPVTKELWNQISLKHNKARKFGGLAFGGIIVGLVSGSLMVSNGEAGKIDTKYGIPVIVSGLMIIGGFTGFVILDKDYRKNIKSAIDVYNSCVEGNYQSSINYKLQIGFSDFSTPSIGLNVSF